ncbi:nuclear transport factor 2 family protein [Xanthomonas translucens pv. translucens]|nr:nuclear transport factor 2 family protein [Xanthomonas translucens pv. translucens]
MQRPHRPIRAHDLMHAPHARQCAAIVVPLQASAMRLRHLVLFALLGASGAVAAADDDAAVRAADARYWQAYNACDMRAMGELLTDDAEFYHDKTGLTASKPAVLHSLRNGPCAARRSPPACSSIRWPAASRCCRARIASTCGATASPNPWTARPSSPISGKRSMATGACAASTAMRTARRRTWRPPRT